MQIRTRFTTALVTIGVLTLLVGARAAGPSLPTAIPEEVGLSSERLSRISDSLWP